METPNIDDIKRIIRDLVLEEYPNNSGALLYGSCLFEQFSNVNDIDVVVLNRSSVRKRLTAIIHGKEVHISLLSKDVFQKDSLESHYGEYYLNKVINPCFIISDSDDIREVITLGRRAKVIHTLTRTPRECITFTAMDLYKYIAYIRMIQFPHFATTVVRLFGDAKDSAIVETLDSYQQILSDCLKVDLVHESRENSFCTSVDITTKSTGKSNIPLVDFSIVRRYWEIFAQVHGNTENICEYHNRHLDTLLRLGTKCQVAMARVTSSAFLFK